jgi:hypothetical protein
VSIAAEALTPETDQGTNAVLPTQLSYTKAFFEDIVISKLGYNPRIEIKPAHLANGLFRAVCGGHFNNDVQHIALYPKGYPVLDAERIRRNKKLQQRLAIASPTQHEALDYLDTRPRTRGMLTALLGADKTMFRSVNTSAYTLSHASHLTSDNHDRQAGRWLGSIIFQGSDHPAWDLLHALLSEAANDRNDELSIITLPLAVAESQLKNQTALADYPDSLATNADGKFVDPLVQTLRKAFDQLAANDNTSARGNGKLDSLRHFVTLACLAVYLHLANANRATSLTPIVFCSDSTQQSVRQASVASYQRVRASLDDFFVQQIVAVLEGLVQTGAWDTDQAIEQRIRQTIYWSKGARRSAPADESMQSDCIQFYRSYRSATANDAPLEALGRALKDMQGIVLSSTPQDVARGLGTRIGLLSPHSERHKKTYEPHPDLLEVLIRATLPAGTTCTLYELAELWAKSFGIWTGALGNENERLEPFSLEADPFEWRKNAEALAEILETSGYARRYADGVVTVSVR